MTCPSCGRENPEGFIYCGFCGAALAEIAVPATEERKVVSVLFCDLVGFTARSDQADPEDVKATLRPLHARLKREIEAFGGTLDKFIGDAALGVFGSPVSHEDDPERAVRAALSIQESMAELNEAHPGLQLAVRQGVNTGEAVVAYGSGAGPLIGEAVTGDVVNTASRLQSVAPVGGIVVGEATYRATKNVFVYEALEPVTVKGKAEPLPIYRAVRALGRLGAELTRAHTTPFIGRREEFALLKEAYVTAASDSSARLATVVGEPGVGKSRLVAELSRYLESLPEPPVWRRGRCLAYGEGITFWALGEIVKTHAGILESDTPEEAVAKLDAVVPNDEPDREWLKQRLGPLVGVEAASGADREEAFTAWRRFLESLGSTGPAIFVFEDVHWADRAMLDFIQYVIDASERIPMLLVCTARPELYERKTGWGRASPNATTIDLRPLSTVEAARLIAALLEQVALPVELQDLLLERAGGNPLYAEEFVRMLKDQELLVRSGRTWQLVEDADVPFPESIQSLIAARLDTLTPPGKAVLQDASVVGRVFWSGALAVMGRCDDTSLREALGELSRKEFVRPVPVSSIEGEDEYVFWHALVRDVCYGQVPRAARAAKHRAAAQWTEGVAAERVEDLAEVLAHHYTTALDLARATGQIEETAGIARSALRFLVLAGDRALGLDVVRAEAHYARALDLAGPESPERPDLLAKWADAVRQAGRAREAAVALDEAVEALLARGDRPAAARTMGTLSTVLVATGSARQEEVAAEAIGMLEAEPPGPDLVAAYARMAGVKLVLGAARETIAWVDRAVVMAEGLGLEVPARALGFRGYARCSLGDPDGLEDMRVALALAVERGEGRDAAVLHNNLAVALMPVEGPASALAACEEGIGFSERRGIREFAVALAAASLDPLVDAGEWDRALELAGTIEAHAEEHGDIADQLQARWVRARVLAARGEGSRAEPLADWLIEAAREAGGTEDAIAGFTAASMVLMEVYQPQRALDLLTEVDRMPNVREGPTYPAHLCEMVRIAIRGGDLALASRLAGGIDPVFPYHQHSQCAVAAILAEARGEPGEAAERYGEAAERWESFGVVPERAHAHLGRGRCLLALGRPAEAERPLQEAREIFARLGAKPVLSEIQLLLGRVSALKPG